MKRSKMVNDAAKIKQDGLYIWNLASIVCFRVGQGGEVNSELTAMTSISEILTRSYDVPCVAPVSEDDGVIKPWHLSLFSLPGH